MQLTKEQADPWGLCRGAMTLRSAVPAPVRAPRQLKATAVGHAAARRPEKMKMSWGKGLRECGRGRPRYSRPGGRRYTSPGYFQGRSFDFVCCQTTPATKSCRRAPRVTRQTPLRMTGRFRCELLRDDSYFSAISARSASAYFAGSGLRCNWSSHTTCTVSPSAKSAGSPPSRALRRMR